MNLGFCCVSDVGSLANTVVADKSEFSLASELCPLTCQALPLRHTDMGHTHMVTLRNKNGVDYAQSKLCFVASIVLLGDIVQQLLEDHEH